MRAFLAVSVAPHGPGHLFRPVRAALAGLADGETAVERVVESTDGWVAFAGGDGNDLVPNDGGGFTVRLCRAARTRRNDLSTADLAVRMVDGGDLTEVLPPFAAAHRAGPDGPVTVATDWLGYRQLYWWSGAGVAAISTSARALAVLADGGFDPVGLAAQAMIGWQIGDSTIYSGVRTLPPATVATLTGGALQQRQYAQRPARPDPPPRLDDAVAEMATILREWQTRYLEQHPDAVLQLTGGHDSRILLGAIPEQMRPGLRALTVGSATNPDVRIAARLAARYGIAHQVQPLDQEPWPAPAAMHALVVAAANALECLASPLALAPLLLAEGHLEQGHRLSGLGGEVARGFYYAGQPTDAVTSPRLVERLARWRLFANEAVEAAALDQTFLAQAQQTTLARLADLFPPGDWLRATDEFYLYHRMYRWAGVHGTVAAVRRHTINPMFDRRFIELALAVAPADKRDSLLLGRLMNALDPELARIPLDSGLVPARLGTRSTANRLAVAALTARKGARKVRQRLTRSRRPQLGADGAAALVLAHWRAEPSAAKALSDVPILNQDWLHGLLTGAHGAEPTTVAFLVNLLAAAVVPRTSSAPDRP
ncbi:MAG: asparagine synthase-related protein [Micromonosporaceae bacterium]